MSRIVVDLGCMTRNGSNSVEELAKEYAPTIIYGFDPSPELESGLRRVRGVPVVQRRMAAWVSNETRGFVERGSTSTTVTGGGEQVNCFDFSKWIRALKKPGDTLIVKMDIEGDEIPVIERMIKDGTDELLDLLLIEWHGAGEPLEAQLRCPFKRWWM